MQYLPQPFWDTLHIIAAERKISVASLVSEIDTNRSTPPKFGLSSTIRVFILEYYKS